jgi:hypothetical protein
MDSFILGDILLLFINIPLLITKIVTLMVIVNESYSIDEKIRSMNNEKGVWFYFKRGIGVAKILKEEVKEFDDISKPNQLPKDDDGEVIG